jgi:hypothetical protein
MNGSGAHPASCPMGTRGSFPGVKRPGREADHSQPSNAPLEHPPYSPGLAPCFLWELLGKKFRSDQRSAARFREVIGAL